MPDAPDATYVNHNPFNDGIAANYVSQKSSQPFNDFTSAKEDSKGKRKLDPTLRSISSQ